jgi:hypothetical protein
MSSTKKQAARAGKKKAAASGEGAVQKKRGEGQRVSYLLLYTVINI